jgi:branched-chain amino acid transport system permease protein
MTDFLRFTIVGIVTGAVYAVAASGLVVTYTTSGIFNFAHGAIGMVLAFMFWELSVNQGLNTVVALVLVVGVMAPLVGVVLERVLFRRMADATVGQSLVVTVGLLVLLLGLAQTIWKAAGRNLPSFFPGSSVSVAGVVITYHEITTIIIGAVVAIGLRVLLFNTRLGVAMRAVVDSRDLASQNGILPERVSAAAWALGTALAGVAGILLAPALSMSQIILTLLVINGYAAAILGQLKSLPKTYVGAMLLGIAESYVIGYGSNLDFGRGWLGADAFFNEIKSVVPVIFLLVFLVFLPHARLRVGRVIRAATPRVPPLTASLRNSAIFLVVALVASLFLSDSRLLDVTVGLCLGMVMLSLVLLSGYAGQIALCQFTFAGIGALVMGKLFPGGQLFGLLVVFVFTALVGALVALPALRLQDLYLGLVTFSVALFADKIVFDHPRTYDNGGNLFFDRVAIGPVELTSDRARFMVAVAGFALFAVLVLAIRRGRFGRMLAAMSDSPAAAATLGMSILRTKMAVFALLCGMAGVAGALFGVTRGSAGAVDFDTIRSLYIYLLATIGGITTVTGAFIGGVVSTALPIIQEEWVPQIQLTGLFIGIGAIVVSRSPNGLAGLVLTQIERLRRRRVDPAATAEPAAPVAPVATEAA